MQQTSIGMFCTAITEKLINAACGVVQILDLYQIFYAWWLCIAVLFANLETLLL